MAWNLGANDAASPCGTPVGTGVIGITRAIILFSIFTAIGAVLQGYMNVKTISSGVVPRIDPLGAITITLAAGVWSTLCTWKGLEISNTYSIVGSVIGYALVVYGSFEVSVISNIVASWVISPLISIVLAFMLYKLFTRLFKNYLDNARFQRVISISLLVSLCFSAYGFGANNIGLATGVFVAVTQEVAGLPDSSTMLILALFSALGVAVGGLTWGHRVIRTIAFKIVRIDALSGLAAQSTNALVVFLFVTIPYLYLGYGIPVSTSIVGIGALIGTSLAKKDGTINKSTMGRLVITWILTIPITATISATLYTILTH